MGKSEFKYIPLLCFRQILYLSFSVLCSIKAIVLDGTDERYESYTPVLLTGKTSIILLARGISSWDEYNFFTVPIFIMLPLKGTGRNVLLQYNANSKIPFYLMNLAGDYNEMVLRNH